MIKKKISLKKSTPKKIQQSDGFLEKYTKTLFDLKKQVQEAQIKATLSANKELIQLYWNIGKTITEKQKLDGWGTNTYATYEKVAQAVRQIEDLPIFNIPWGHNIRIIQKLKNNKERLWYAQKSIDNGWSRSILEIQLESNLYGRQDQAITNFNKTLPTPDSDMAQQALKDPYIFDFLTLHNQHLESDLECGLINHIQSFLLELGEGFAFIGRQYHAELEKHEALIAIKKRKKTL